MVLTCEQKDFLNSNPRIKQVSFGMGSQNLYHHPLRGTYTLDDLLDFSKIEYFKDTDIPYALAYNSPLYLKLSDFFLARISLSAALRRKIERGNGGTMLFVEQCVNGKYLDGYRYLRNTDLHERNYKLRLCNDAVSICFID